MEAKNPVEGENSETDVSGAEKNHIAKNNDKRQSIYLFIYLSIFRNCMSVQFTITMLILNIKLQAEGHKRIYDRYKMALISLDNEQKIVNNACKS